MTAIAQRSFASGEVAPAFYGRVDQQRYQSGLKTLRNFLVKRTGGADNRPGTAFTGEERTYVQYGFNGSTLRMIPFIFNNSQTYVMVFGDQTIRFVQNGAFVLEAAKNITTIALNVAQNIQITIVGHGFSSGDVLYVNGVTSSDGLFQPNGMYVLVHKIDNDHFEIFILDGNGFAVDPAGPAYSGGTVARVYTVVTPYAYTDLPALRTTQSADVVDIVHPSYAPRQLSRVAQTNWTLGVTGFGSSTGAPSTVGVSGTVGGTYASYKVCATAVGANGEESEKTVYAGSALVNVAFPSPSGPITVHINPVNGAISYKVYRETVPGSNLYGFIGITNAALTSGGTYNGTVPFDDIGIASDNSLAPPVNNNPFTGANNYPGAVGSFQSRKIFGQTINNPDTVYTSKTGFFLNFDTSLPVQDDDAVTFEIAGQRVNTVQHFLDIGKLGIFTSGGIFVAFGDAAGALKPSAINLAQQSFISIGNLRPIPVDYRILFVQSRGSHVRDLAYDIYQQKYHGDDLTLFSQHLFDGYSIVDWDYAEIPNYIVWCVRNDGILLGLTYIKDQQMMAWHRHDFQGGLVENVCAIPEGGEDAVYLVINRSGRRFIERMSSRVISDVKKANFLDVSRVYDGTADGSKQVKLTGGTNWTYDEQLTLQSDSAAFTATDIDKAFFISKEGGTLLRCVVVAYTDTTHVTVKTNKTVPVSMRGVYTAAWSRAVKSVGGLGHLEGKTVSVFADGFVVASQNNPNPDYLAPTVKFGAITLDKWYAYINVGLSITADIETLGIDTPQGETLMDKKKIISRVTALVEVSRGVFAGPDANSLTEWKVRDSDTDEEYDNPVAPRTGHMDINIEPRADYQGQVFIRQFDPVPLSILALTPSGLVPIR